ncbi:hypothetical protein ACHABQ_12135 [Nesterenkonia aurantiaca]|uniref:hypothetical protein n=1 Tax=Nesterenkonia aurantiaca TaxID=1436010 RepID=UPI003EE72376
MIAVVTLLIAFPAGYFLASRLAANTAYAVAYLWAFVFQTLYLTLDSINPSAEPTFMPGEFPLSYGAVTLGVFGVGFGLVALGHLYRARQTSRRAQSATLGG